MSGGGILSPELFLQGGVMKKEEDTESDQTSFSIGHFIQEVLAQ